MSMTDTIITTDSTMGANTNHEPPDKKRVAPGQGDSIFLANQSEEELTSNQYNGQARRNDANGHDGEPDGPWTAAKKRLSTAGRVISLADDKLMALSDLADAFAMNVRDGFLSRLQVSDRLNEIADAYGLYAEHGIDEVQRIIADGLDRAIEPQSKPARKANAALSTRNTTRNNRANGGGGLVSKLAADIKPESVTWLWPGRLAIGKHTCVAGEPGTGKSQLSIAIIAAITTGGEWPCGEGRAPLGSVIILSAEDGAADTIVPRLIAAGADLARVHIVSSVYATDGEGRRSFNLQTDIALLERKIAEIGDVVLVGVDPVSSYMGKADSHKNSEVRGVLEPLSGMADRTRTAILTITHFSKAGAANNAKALHRFIGSIAFTGAPRAAFAVIDDAENEGRKLFLHAKNNLAAPPQGLAFRLEQRIVADNIVASRVAWDSEPVTITANQALAAEAAGTEGMTAKDEAIDFLKGILAPGPMPARRVKAEAAEAGISAKSLRSAREKLRITPEKTGFGGDGSWLSSLPKVPL
jgi:hypothetical protein